MDSRSRPDELPLRQARQFSVRELLILTFAVSLILTVGIVSRDSKHFGAFSSLWALASLAPVAIILTIGRFRFASPRVLAFASIVFYAASLCTPAIGLRIFNSPSIIWGWQALYVSAISIVELPDFFIELLSFEAWGDDAFGALAYVMGNIVNVAYFLAVILFFVGIKKPKALTLCRRASIFSAVLATAVMMSLALTTDLTAIYPGYGLWVASCLALAFAARRVNSPI